MSCRKHASLLNSTTHPMFTDRKSSYKLPPTTIRDKLVSQEARRNKALEEQKRRRAQRVDSTRQLDLFAGLTLGASDDEDAPSTVLPLVDAVPEEGLEAEDEPQAKVAPGSVAQYAAMLLQGHQHQNPNGGDQNVAIGSGNSSAYTQTDHPPPPESAPVPSNGDADANEEIEIDGQQLYCPEPEPEPTKPRSSGSKKKHNGGGAASKQKRRANKASKWADKCMYAELLEMSADEPWDRDDAEGDEFDTEDGLPKDLENGWVAVAPVPVGKRCLAVTQTSAGVAGVVPNTTLRSRLLGKTLLARFPSSLPPLTVLDCILDKRWRENGIVHVLDVVQWKGQDVGDCEAGFRFWWRDTRLVELGQTRPPLSSSSPHPFLNSQQPNSNSTPPYPQQQQKYTFPYPTSFIPVPYHTNTSLATMDREVIPAARAWREVSILSFSTPALVTLGMHSAPSLPLHLTVPVVGTEGGGMDVELLHMPAQPPQPPALTATPAPMPAHIEPDGMLLYVAEASYEPGTSPLSSWVPIRGYEHCDGGAAQEEGRVESGAQTVNEIGKGPGREGPLDLFQRLVRRRIARQARAASGRSLVEMDEGARGFIGEDGGTGGGDVDVEMDI